MPRTWEELVQSAKSTPGRYEALDVARGLAVLGMIYAHFVPMEGASALWGQAANRLAEFVESPSAALFCVLAGMSWAIQASRFGASRRFPAYVARRAVVLAAAGFVFQRTVWPTEILLPLAVMMPLCLIVGRAGRWAVVACCLLLLVLAPAIPALWGGFVLNDWEADGTHVANHAVGWVTLRYLAIDGNYPVVSWMAFPLLGMAMLGSGSTLASRASQWLAGSVMVWVLAQGVVGLAKARPEALGSLAPQLSSTWVPTSMAFLVLNGALAVAVIVGLLWWQSAGHWLRRAKSIALLGRASLTHYLLHICIVFVPLRVWYPDEDWPLQVGLAAFAGYVLVSLLVTPLWFRRFPRGPFEAAWMMVSGRPR